MADKILHLSLKKKPFEVMVTGEKNIEYREDSDWIRSRLMHQFGNKEYDYVKFTNGYGANRPFFVCKYNGYEWAKGDGVNHYEYSNGLIVREDCESTIRIKLGEIVYRGNMEVFNG